MVVVYASSRDIATRIFLESMRKNNSKVIDDFVELFKSKTHMENVLIDKLAKEFKEQIWAEQLKEGWINDEVD